MARIMIKLTSPLFYFFFFFSFLSHQTMSQPNHMQTFCNPIENFTQTSLYEINRNLLLSTLAITSSLVPYLNATIGLTPDTVFGMFLCRGDMDTKSCSVCVETAATQIATNCGFNKRAVIYYQECMVHYSNVDFFSQLETVPRIVVFSSRNAPNLNQFNQTLSNKFEQLIPKVSLSSSIPYFVKDQELVTQLEGSYEIESMVQCTPDLDPLSCTACLRDAFLRVSTCCGSPSSAQIFAPKCLLRYTTTVLSSPSPSPPQASPPQSSPHLSLSQPPQAPPPLVFTRPNALNPSGSFSVNVIKGNEIFGRILVAMVALVFALVEL